jgi:hypothetical protein
MDSYVVVRVESLLADPQEPVRTQKTMIYSCAGLAAITLMFAAEPLHQLIETVLGLLIG